MPLKTWSWHCVMNLLFQESFDEPLILQSSWSLHVKSPGKTSMNFPCRYFQPGDFWVTQTRIRTHTVPRGPLSHKKHLTMRFGSESGEIFFQFLYYSHSFTILQEGSWVTQKGFPEDLKLGYCGDCLSGHVAIIFLAHILHLIVPCPYYTTLYSKINTITKELCKL